MKENIERFVYDGVEVLKTGRVAVKKHPTSGKIISTLFEIETIPNDTCIMWRKWVGQLDLFLIEKVDPKVEILMEE